MKTIRIALVCVSLLFAFSLGTFAQDATNLTLTPAHPVQGEPVTLAYNPDETPLKDAKNIELVVYKYVNYKWQTEDVDIKPEGKIWKGSLLLEPDCGFFALKFKSQGKVDNNKGKGYVWNVQSKTGGLAVGGRAGWGLSRSPNLGYTIPNYFDAKYAVVSDTVTYFWLNQEVTFNPSSALPLAYSFACALDKIKTPGYEARLNRVVDFLCKSGSEQNLIDASSILQNMLNRKSAADSLTQVVLSKFPKGNLARLKAYRTITIERDATKRQQACVQFLTDFPQSTTDAQYDETNWISYDNIYQMMILMGAAKKDYAPLKQYLPALSFGGGLNMYYKLIDIAHKRKDIPDADLLENAQLIVKHVEKVMDIKPLNQYFLSPKEWHAMALSQYADVVLISYVNLLKNVGHADEALAYAKLAQEQLKYSQANLNSDEAELLNAKGDTKTVNEIVAKSLYNNQASVYILDLAKKQYVAEHHSEEGFEAYLEAQKNPALKKASKGLTDKDKRSGAMPAWKMVDANGKVVTSESLKGKTYILDFWASWCVPCKASFPGMKLAVERYKNDPSVQFFFVDTEERTPTYKQQAIKYLKDNNFPFQLLFDNKAPKAESNDEVFSRIAKAFTISGIPQKIFVDKNGNVQYISVGYKGSASQLADEISEMVEQTKAIK